jgi:hypothetical protein
MALADAAVVDGNRGIGPKPKGADYASRHTPR